MSNSLQILIFKLKVPEKHLIFIEKKYSVLSLTGREGSSVLQLRSKMSLHGLAYLLGGCCICATKASAGSGAFGR